MRTPGSAQGSARVGLTTACILIAGMVACDRACAEQPGPPTDEDRAVVQAVLAQEKPEEQITDDLIDLLLSEDWHDPGLAAEELKKRELNQNHVGRLRTIVHEVPFNRQGDVRSLNWPGADVCSLFAWLVLAEVELRGKSVEEQVAWLIPELRYCRPFASSRSNAAANRLEKLGQPAVPALVRALTREGSNAQLWSVRTLSSIATDEAKAAIESWGLANLETTDDGLIWGTAANYLGSIKSQAAYEPLVRTLRAHLDEPSIYSVVHALEQIGDPRAPEVFAEVLAQHKPDADHLERIEPYLWAAAALAKTGDERGLAALREAAESPLVELRRHVPFAAYTVKTAQARQILERLTSDQDQRVASQAKSWLEELDRALAP
jgi:hypothetical protein